MQLRELFEGRLTYVDRGHWTAPYHENEFIGYAEADGEVRGERVQGRVRCLNHPTQLSASPEIYHPDYHGVIWTDDGATILWRFQGRNIFDPQTSSRYLGRALMVSTFATGDRRYRWLNETLAVIEALCTGSDDPAEAPTEQWRLRAFECVHELPTNPL